MTSLDPVRLEAYRAGTFRLHDRVRSPDDALAFVRERGFIFFWPITGVVLPNLWAAVAGDRPVADEHDDPGHVTWGWKDRMLSTRQWYYAKVLRGKATIIDLDWVPFFYALSENYGVPEEDYLEQYAAGRLSREARVVYETLLAHGSLDTVRLRREAHLSGSRSKSPFDRALVTLQRDFKILPVGVAEAGAWHYSHVYAPVHVWYPELPERARSITRSGAREHLLQGYFTALGAATKAEALKLFRWRPRDLDRTLEKLVAAGALVSDVTIAGRAGLYYTLAGLADR